MYAFRLRRLARLPKNHLWQWPPKALFTGRFLAVWTRKPPVCATVIPMQIAARDIRACRPPEGLPVPGVVSWSGGVTGTLKTAHLAEAFHMPCEIHIAISHPLEMMNLQVCRAIRNFA